jgi:Gamma-glutamyl cyclotransferase, AIG2-like
LRLFLYGTLLDPDVLEARAGLAGLGARLRPARLDGWRRAALRGTVFPTLERAAGAVVDGAVIDLPATGLARIAAYEGPAYWLVRVAVRTARVRMVAHAWIAPAAVRRPKPRRA